MPSSAVSLDYNSLDDNSLKSLEVLFPYQKAWLADTSSVAVCEKSRRTGMSWVEALAQVLCASSSREAGGMNAYYLAYNKDMTRQFIQDATRWAEKIGQVAKEYKEDIWNDPEHPERDTLVYTLRFASGFEIQALPSKPTALRSKQGRVCVDEVAFVEDLAAVRKAAMALLMWGGQIRFISTHNGVENPFNEMILECRSGKQNYSVHRIDIHKALAEGLYQRICQTQGQIWSPEAEEKWLEELIADHGEGAAEELFCMPQGTASKYFPRHLLDICTVLQGQIARSQLDDAVLHEGPEQKEARVREFFRDYIGGELKRSRGRVYAGRDFARSGDLSALWFFELVGDRLEHVVLIEMRNWPHSMQYRVCVFCLELLGSRFAGGAWDARGNGEAEAENLAVEFGRIECVKATTNWYNENFPKLKCRFEDKRITIPNDTLVLDDFRTVVVKNGVPVIGERTKEAGKRRVLRHGDCAVAAVMAECAYQQDDGGYYPIEFEVVARSEWDGDDNEDDDEWD